MPDTIDPHSQAKPGAGAAGASGCVVFLVDESAAMDARVAGGTKSKAETIATALNSLLNQLTAGPAVDVAIVGYRTPSHGGQDVGCRWGGALAGRQFVPSSELAGAPLAVENRVRKVPGSGGVGVAREETVQFPVWYAPSLGGTASRTGAFEHCCGMLSTWLSTAGPNPKPPMLVSFLGELGSQETPQAVGQRVQELATPGGPPLVIHAHLSSSDRVPATLYPSSDTHLPPGAVRTLFQATSVLPEAFVASLRELQVTVNAGARGLIYNAKMVDLIRFLSLVRAYAQYRPPVEPALPAPAATPIPAAEAAAAETPPTAVLATDGSTPDAPTVQMPAPDSPTVQVSPADAGTESVPAAEALAAEQAALVVLLLDRSVESPTGEEAKSVWQRLQEQANELLGQVAKRGKGRIDAAVVSYGSDPSGQTEVQTTFSGPLAGRTMVGDADLAEGAIRVDEVTEQVSNGIGGLVSVTRKRPVFVEMKPTAASALSPAFAAVKGLLAEWRSEHAESRVPPVVLHMTRGRFNSEEIDEAVGQLRASGEPSLYHLVLTESPHRSLAYPPEPTGIQDPHLVKLWELSSPLLGSHALAARKTAVTPQSRGIVINGKFDLLLDAVEEALSAMGSG